MNPVLEAALGNRTAAWTLLFLAAYGEGHANRIANTYGLAVSVVRDQLLRLEANGVSGQPDGRASPGIPVQRTKPHGKESPRLPAGRDRSAAARRSATVLSAKATASSRNEAAVSHHRVITREPSVLFLALCDAYGPDSAHPGSKCAHARPAPEGLEAAVPVEWMLVLARLKGRRSTRFGGRSTTGARTSRSSGKRSSGRTV